MTKRLYLIDGTALIYRSYYAFINNPLRRKDGFVTSAIYGTINTVLRLIEDFSIEHVFISFDRKEKSFRHEMTEDYKAHRPDVPEDLIPQFEPIKEFFDIVNFAKCSKAGYEADDVLATIARKKKDEFDQVYIVSGDKDFVQLVDDKISLLDPFKKTTLRLDDVYDKYGIKVKQFKDYLALIGDSADNVPGVKGIGPKTAQKILNNFPTLEDIYENLEALTNGQRKKLTKYKAEAFLSKKLVTIEQNVELEDIEKEKYNFTKEDLVNAADFLKKYEISSLMKKINKISGKSETAEEEESGVSFKEICVNDEKEFDNLLQKLDKFELIALDTETTSLDPFEAELVGISLAFEKKSAYYLPLNHNMAKNLDQDFALPKLKKALENKKIVGHNLKYDLRILEKYDWKFDNHLFDTMIASYLIDPNQRKHSLDNAAKNEFDYKMTPYKEVVGTGKKQITFDLVDLKSATFYAAEDAYITFLLYQRFISQLKKKELYSLFEKVEMPLMHVLMEMEKKGVYIDKDFLNKISEKLNKRISEIQNKIFEIAGEQFNINSTQQLGKILFEKLEIDPIKKTKTGFSTNKKVLEKLSEKGYEIADLLLEYRELYKLESTYISALPKLINSQTGRIHSSFNQTVTTTGRLSSSNPNLQNIPIRSKLGREIRKAFSTKNEDCVILAADYSQIELRILAILSQDPNLVNAYEHDKDIHTQTAALIFDKKSEEVTPDDRSQAKTINFGIIYGMGARKLSKELKIKYSEAKKFIKNYFEKFPTIKDFIDSYVKKAQTKGYAETILNRKLELPDINSSNKFLKSIAERVALNMPIQGSAADIIKIAMIDLHEELKERDDIKMLIQVHDELVFEIKKDSLEEAKAIIKKNMESALPKELAGKIPMKVDIGTGKNWFQAH